MTTVNAAPYTPLTYTEQVARGRAYTFLRHASRHGVIINDAGAGMTADPAGMDIDTALTRGGLDFVVEMEGAQSAPDATGATYAFPDHRCLLRVNADGTKSALSIMRSRYQIVQ